MKVLMKTGSLFGVRTNSGIGLQGKIVDEKKAGGRKCRIRINFYPAKDNQQEMLEQLRDLFQKERREGNDQPFSVETKNRIV